MYFMEFRSLCQYIFVDLLATYWLSVIANIKVYLISKCYCKLKSKACISYLVTACSSVWLSIYRIIPYVVKDVGVYAKKLDRAFNDLF